MPGKTITLTMTVTGIGNCSAAIVTATYTVIVQNDYPITNGTSICPGGTWKPYIFNYLSYRRAWDNSY